MLELYRGTLRGLHGEAFSRAAAEAARLQAGLHGDQGARCTRPAWSAGAAALGASQEAAAPADGGHDAASGCLAHAWLPGDDRQLRSGGDARRRDQRDLLGISGRGGGHGLELSRARRGDRRDTVCFAPSIPTAAATTSTRPRPASRCRRAFRPRLAARWRSSASSTSRPIRRRRAAARSGPSAPCRTVCPRSSSWPGSRRSRPPTAGSPRPICPAHNAAFAVRRPSAGTAFVADRTGRVARHPVHPGGAHGSATTTPSSGAAWPADPTEPAAAALRAAPWCASTSTPTGAWRSSMGRIGWPITTPRESRATPRNWLREPLRQPACGFVDNATRYPQLHSPNHHRSGQLMRYENRSTWRVSNTFFRVVGSRLNYWCAGSYEGPFAGSRFPFPFSFLFGTVRPFRGHAFLSEIDAGSVWPPGQLFSGLSVRAPIYRGGWFTLTTRQP